MDALHRNSSISVFMRQARFLAWSKKFSGRTRICRTLAIWLFLRRKNIFWAYAAHRSPRKRGFPASPPVRLNVMFAGVIRGGDSRTRARPFPKTHPCGRAVSRPNPGTACDRIPRGVCPFNSGIPVHAIHPPIRSVRLRPTGPSTRKYPARGTGPARAPCPSPLNGRGRDPSTARSGRAVSGGAV